MSTTSRKKPRLQKEPIVDDMEVEAKDSEFLRKLQTFAKDNELDTSIAEKLRELRDEVSKLSSEQASVALWGKLEEAYPEFTLDHAKKACAILFPSPRLSDSSHETVLPKNIAERAWKSLYVLHGGGQAFWDHLKKQKQDFEKNFSTATRFPFFVILQSSGYGKSRLVDELRKDKESKQPQIIYFSFAAQEAHPAANVHIDFVDLRNQGRGAVTNAFVRLFDDAWEHPEKEKFRLSWKDDDKSCKEDSDHTTKATTNGETLFVLDEASQLLKFHSADDVSFFRCLRKATTNFWSKHHNCFFVLLATFSSTNKIMPGIRHDPSFKLKTTQRDEMCEPMKPFLLHEAIGLRNNETEILGCSVNECLQAKNLLSMGRPMWKANIEALTEESVSHIVNYAEEKLLLAFPSPSPSSLTIEQTLALLACRACLTISPVSWLAPTLVGSHMATAVEISENREEVVVSYPSEPALAVGARQYMKRHQNDKSKHHEDEFLVHGFSHLKQYLLSGAVPKGHRGEVIVRLLNLLAIDRSMRPTDEEVVTEVELQTFLSQFDRESASVSDALKATSDGSGLTDDQMKMLKREGILDTVLENEQDWQTEKDDGEKWNGKVCFTHFVHLRKLVSDQQRIITPDLLRYSYRRTAAIVVDDGRRGIDWIIPVRVGDDEFVGLCGQDKNRMRDTLKSLVVETAAETHHKMTADYFLTQQEKQLFAEKEWSLDWPAILFSIDSCDVGAALAKAACRKRLRSSGSYDTTPFPCIVLTGLGYLNLVSTEADARLAELRNAVAEVPSVYKKNVPLTYGTKSDWEITRSP